MAEHVRNELARARIPVRPNRIQTLAKFIEPFTPLAEAPESLLTLLLARELPNEFPSYHRALASLLSSSLTPIPEKINEQLANLGVALREQRLQSATPVAAGPIILDGFFALSQAELSILQNLATQTQVTVTLPTWPGAASARASLLQNGFDELHLEATQRIASQTIHAALSLEQEVEQIARTILDHAAKGRQFREMGVLLRVRDPYGAALESTFARLGIPARFHFPDVLSAHPAIQYLSGLIRSLLTGWNQEDLLPLLRMPISGVGATPEGDRLDFEIRASIPSGAGSRPALRIFEIDPWKNDRLTPAAWSEKLKTLRTFLPIPEIQDQIDRDQLNLWRSTAAALNAFESALETTALALPPEPIQLAKFWPHAEIALDIEKLRIPDRRHNVVNVLDIYEARQWELPIAFVCGLNERHFPQYHRDDPLLPDPARTIERQHEERFLFDLAVTRSTEQTILSYARFNEKGDPQLRSFFLEEAGVSSNPTRLIPRTPRHQVGQVPDLSIPNPKLSPTSIESFLQCPFQFFARKTLKLRPRPDKPRDRLNNLLQGNILHRALAEGDLDQVFEEECEKNNIPKTYRTEAIRLELERHFEAFRADNTWPLNWPSQTEQNFELALTPELTIRGRIDRLDRGPNNQAIVIDYKYSAAAKIRERIEGDPIQAGLYLSAAERYFNLHPAGMFYCGLRQSVTWEGWHTAIPGLAIGESRTTLRELIEVAEQKAKEVHASIIGGDIAVRPADRDKCRYCDYNNICRVESIVRITTTA